MQSGSRSAGLRAACIALALLGAPAPAPGAGDGAWSELAPGLELGSFALGETSASGAQVRVLRVDPRRWELTLHGIPPGESFGHSAREWSRRERLVAAINAGMYQTDYRTHSGYMAADGTVHSRGTNAYLSAAAFEPLDPADPPFRIVDLDEEPLPALLPRYRRVVQNLRMVKRPGENRWMPQERRWSEAALGEDREGRALFIFCAAPLPLERLIRALLELPLGLVAAQHLEGGSQAQLFVEAGGVRLELIGASSARPIPNVIGVRKRGAPGPR